MPNFNIVIPPSGSQTPNTSVQPVAQSAFGRYLSLSAWKLLLRHAIQYRYWMRAAAIAYGFAFCLLLSFFGLLAATSIDPEFLRQVATRLTQWGIPNVDVINTLVAQTANDWQPRQRWFMLIASSLFGLSLWLKMVGAAQQILRENEQQGILPIPSLRQRLTTLFLAVVTIFLLLLAYGFVFVTLPHASEPTATNLTLWASGKYLATRGLRWSLAFSTIALMFGLFYRLSLTPAAVFQPILPGTVVAAIIWTGVAVGLKIHMASVLSHHWLYSIVSTVTLILFSIYLETVGLLLGGRFNTLMKYYVPQPRSNVRALPPAPSFDSFTIQRRPNRRM